MVGWGEKCDKTFSHRCKQVSSNRLIHMLTHTQSNLWSTSRDTFRQSAIQSALISSTQDELCNLDLQWHYTARLQAEMDRLQIFPRTVHLVLRVCVLLPSSVVDITPVLGSIWNRMTLCLLGIWLTMLYLRWALGVCGSSWSIANTRVNGTPGTTDKIDGNILHRGDVGPSV